MLKKIRVATSKKPAASSNYFRRTSVGGAMDAVPLYVANVQSAAFADAGQRAYQMASGASVGADAYHAVKQAQTARYDAAAQRAYQLASGASLGAMRMTFPQVGGSCGSVGAGVDDPVAPTQSGGNRLMLGRQAFLLSAPPVAPPQSSAMPVAPPQSSALPVAPPQSGANPLMLNRMSFLPSAPVRSSVQLKPADMTMFAVGSENAPSSRGGRMVFDISASPSGWFGGWVAMLVRQPLNNNAMVVRKADFDTSVAPTSSGARAFVDILAGEVPFALVVAGGGPAPSVTLRR